MSTTQRLRRAAAGTDDATLRLAARLLLGGQLLFIVITQFHTGGDANDHSSMFAKYADSGDWKGVYALQFAVVAGLVVFYRAIEERTDGPSWAARIGAVSLALYGVLQAVDGIGNKQVDQAWVNAGTAQKSGRFASAEAMRWLEWGLSSYHAYAVGLSLILLAGAATAGIGRSRRCGRCKLPRRTAAFGGSSRWNAVKGIGASSSIPAVLAFVRSSVVRAA